MEHEYESTPRVSHTRRTIVFHSIKISGLSYKATLRWMRSIPGSFRDFPAPRSAAFSARLSEVLASTDHPIRFSPVVGARCRPPKSKINLLPANGYSPSTENGGIVPNHDINRNRSVYHLNGSSVVCGKRLRAGHRDFAEQ